MAVPEPLLAPQSAQLKGPRGSMLPTSPKASAERLPRREFTLQRVIEPFSEARLRELIPSPESKGPHPSAPPFPQPWATTKGLRVSSSEPICGTSHSDASSHSMAHSNGWHPSSHRQLPALRVPGRGPGSQRQDARVRSAVGLTGSSCSSGSLQSQRPSGASTASPASQRRHEIGGAPAVRDSLGTNGSTAERVLRHVSFSCFPDEPVGSLPHDPSPISPPSRRELPSAAVAVRPPPRRIPVASDPLRRTASGPATYLGTVSTLSLPGGPAPLRNLNAPVTLR